MASLKTLADIEDPVVFLDDNYHQISRRIRVENVLDRLRSQRVISQDDQETVLHKYCTQLLKAGLLIDIVKTKGRDGFEKFMEAIEYEYPDVFQETTGIAPRRNDRNTKTDNQRHASMLILDKMGDLIGVFTQQITENKKQMREKELEVADFQTLVTQLKNDLDKQLEDQRIMEEEKTEMDNMLKELREEKKELSERLAKERQARQKLDMECASLRQKKLDSLYDNAHPPVQKSLAINPFVSGLTGQNTQGNEKTRTTKDKTSDLERNLAQLQESNDRLQICIEEFKKESERCRLEQEKTEVESQAVRLENDRLKAELKKMEENCKLLADMNQSLVREIDMRRPPKSNKDFKIPKLFGGTEKKIVRSASDTDTDRKPAPMKTQSTVSEALVPKFFL